ncbi:MAG: hypothetical protein IIC50_13975 [Planctomycetes bacterium]|nr:hypothetical protein [Planctomycetota bacterium]
MPANSNFARNDYVLPVLGLVFPRHAYSRCLRVKDDVEANLPKHGGKTRALSEDDFSQKSAIFLQRTNSNPSQVCDRLLPRLMNGETGA